MASETLESRVERLERILAKLEELARGHPVGRVILGKLGLK
jgi:hypothetical protein